MSSKLVPLLAAATLATSIGSAAAFPGYVRESVGLHSGPGMRYAIVSTIPASTSFEVVGCRQGWCEVQYGSADGFIEAPLVVAGAPSWILGSPLDVLTLPFDVVGGFVVPPPPAPAPAPEPVVAAY